MDEFGDLVPLEEFDYGNDKLGCLLQESMDETYFLGISVSWPHGGTSSTVHGTTIYGALPLPNNIPR